MLRFCFSIRLPLLPLTSAILGFYQRSYVSAPSLPALRRGAHGSTFFGLCLDLAPSQSAVADFQYLCLDLAPSQSAVADFHYPLVSSSRSPSFVVHAVYKTFAGSAVPRALFLFTQPITPFLLNSKLTQGASTLDRGPPVSDSIYETTIFLSAAFCGADCKTMPWNPKALAKHFASGEDSGSLSTPDLPKKDAVGMYVVNDGCIGVSAGYDIVFVHGLRGSRVSTFSVDGIFWLKALLAKDLGQDRILTWGYDADIANVSSFASQESIHGHAETLLDDLAGLRGCIVSFC
jgi:hypothetical protein